MVDISEDDIAIWGYPIPKLMIQPLVENAVFHGLEKKSGKGSVTISTSRTQRRLYLYVVDDGVGMSQEENAGNQSCYLCRDKFLPCRQLRRGNGDCPAEYQPPDTIFIWEGVRLNLESTEGFGTQIEIALPWPPPKEMEKQ